jgi:hypothetical protein
MWGEYALLRLPPTAYEVTPVQWELGQLDLFERAPALAKSKAPRENFENDDYLSL